MTDKTMTLDVDEMAQEIRRVDGNHSLGAGALSEALMPFIIRHLSQTAETPAIDVAAVREVAEWLAQNACIEVPGMSEQADKLTAALEENAK